MIKSIKTENEFNEYRFAAFDSNGALKQASASTDKIIGAVGSPSIGVIDVILSGEVTPLCAGAAFKAGDALTSDSQGRAIAAQNGDNIGAVALEDATAAGDVVDVIVSINRAIAETEENNG